MEARVLVSSSTTSTRGWLVGSLFKGSKRAPREHGVAQVWGPPREGRGRIVGQRPLVSRSGAHWEHHGNELVAERRLERITRE